MVSEDIAALGDGNLADISGMFIICSLAVLPNPYIMATTSLVLGSFNDIFRRIGRRDV